MAVMLHDSLIHNVGISECRYALRLHSLVLPRHPEPFGIQEPLKTAQGQVPPITNNVVLRSLYGISLSDYTAVARYLKISDFQSAY